MFKRKLMSFTCLLAVAATIMGTTAFAGAEDDSVVVTMTTSSEPEAGFDPAYGGEQENMYTNH